MYHFIVGIHELHLVASLVELYIMLMNLYFET